MSVKSLRTGYKGISALAGNVPPGDFESISTVVVGSGGAADIVFSNIPQTYTHLQLRGISKISTSSGYIGFRLNSDTSVNSYTWHSFSGDGASPGTGSSATGTFGWNPITQTLGGSTNVFSGVVIDLLDYKNTNKYKTMRAISGYDNNGSGVIGITSGLWLSTSAVTNITLDFSANDFAQHSTFALYGIRG
jgi:hypothetical protein